MVTYIAMIIISILFLLISNKSDNKTKKIICYILASLSFFLVSALRYDVGTDYLKRYVYDFNRIAQGIEVENFEIGFKVIIYFCLLFTKNANFLFILTSAIIIILIMSTIYSKSKNLILSFLIFFLGGFFFDTLNLVRQYIAISIILFSYRFLVKEKTERKDYLLFIILVMLAMSMHSSSIVAFAIILLNKKMIMNWKWLIPICIGVLILNENLMNLIDWIIQNTRFNVYLTGKMARGEVSVLFILENFLVYIFMYYIFSRNQKNMKNSKEDILLMNIQGVSLLVTVLGACHMQFARIALYFLIFQIISIPNFIYNMPVEEIKKDIDKIGKNKIKTRKALVNIKNIVSAVFIICFITIFWYNNIKNNNNDVVPYKTIFSIENHVKKV